MAESHGSTLHECLHRDTPLVKGEPNAHPAKARSGHTHLALGHPSEHGEKPIGITTSVAQRYGRERKRLTIYF